MCDVKRNKVTGLRGYEVAGLQGYRVTGLQGFETHGVFLGKGVASGKFCVLGLKPQISDFVGSRPFIFAPMPIVSNFSTHK